MPKISREDVEHIAKLSKLSLTDNELEKYQGQLSDVLDYVSQVNGLNTESVKEITILDSTNVSKNDIPENIWSQEELFKNVPREKDGFIVVPAVFKEQEE